MQTMQLARMPNIAVQWFGSSFMTSLHGAMNCKDLSVKLIFSMCIVPTWLL